QRASRRDPSRAPDRLPLPDPPRRPDDAPGLLAHHQAVREEGRYPQEAVAAHGAPCVRYPPAEQRRRPARRTAPARPQRRLDDSDLYARRPRAHEGVAQPPSPARVITPP